MRRLENHNKIKWKKQNPIEYYKKTKVMKIWNSQRMSKSQKNAKLKNIKDQWAEFQVKYYNRFRIKLFLSRIYNKIN